MRVPRIYCAQPLGEDTEIELAGDAGHHVRDVLRLKPGAGLILFNGERGEIDGTLQAAKPAAKVLTGRLREPRVESPLTVRLVQGISRGERMDFTIQKAVELGVAGIVPVATDRSVVRLDAARAKRKHERWQKIAITAAEQSGRTRVPAIAAPAPLRNWLAQLERGESALLLDPAAKATVADLPAPDGPVTILIGSEGGLSTRERNIANQAGFMGVRLGPRILRTETAALVCISLLQARFGDL
jgi:16S rRNA (uracil1498-N3)-methyltransferase